MKSSRLLYDPPAACTGAGEGVEWPRSVIQDGSDSNREAGCAPHKQHGFEHLQLSAHGKQPHTIGLRAGMHTHVVRSRQHGGRQWLGLETAAASGFPAHMQQGEMVVPRVFLSKPQTQQ